MKILVKSALALSLLVGAAGSASAARVGFNIGNVSLGFSDGYWDNDHHWHRWAHRRDMEAWRHDHADMFHAWRHDDRHHHD